MSMIGCFSGISVWIVDFFLEHKFQLRIGTLFKMADDNFLELLEEFFADSDSEEEFTVFF